MIDIDDQGRAALSPWLLSCRSFCCVMKGCRLCDGVFIESRSFSLSCMKASCTLQRGFSGVACCRGARGSQSCSRQDSSQTASLTGKHNSRLVSYKWWQPAFGGTKSRLSAFHGFSLLIRADGPFHIPDCVRWLCRLA